ncbi:hypothetical protein ACU18_00435 [Arthrobacter sp. ZBG10]|uniref:DUF6286 domain-containing protein n=1 Tax=Arthrobacter sp. ZBG10 TaxID=1676590 RepID=UPI00068138C1|nr:DUF6286 domain-containing protein [Arthrobacter sp. ZBG10]KNH23069.1 hypothetical protein ACU18_00435 [Arthrobacter sp. ZBG10]
MSTQPVSQSLQRRSSRTVPAAATSLVLLVLAGLAIWGAVAYLAGGAWPGFIAASGDAVSGLTWNNPGVWAASVVVLLAGVFLLFAAVLPGRRTGAAITGSSSTGLTETVISRRGLARLAAAHADQTDGVESSSATASGKSVSVVVSTSLNEPGSLSRDIKESLEEKFRTVGLTQPPRVSVRVRSSG